jgi:hypothetical protein
MIAAAAAALVLLGGCGMAADPAATAPPRATDPITMAAAPSHIAVDLAVELDAIERKLERSIPRELWTINQQDVACVPPKKVDLGLVKIKSPTITCDISGKATRGRLRLSGRGRDLIITMPVRATIAARDVAGVLKGETATGAANVVLNLKLDLTPDWQLTAEADLDYRWAEEPGIDFLGRRIRFTSAADKELRPLTQQIERELARELARAPIRPAAERGWKAAHAVLELNARNPEVWARLTPHRFLYGGYNVSGRQLTLTLGLDGQVETLVGRKPMPATPAPLPPLARLEGKRNEATLYIPVAADYAVLEPVIAKALAKRAARPFKVRDFGTVMAQFDKIEAYGTTGNRIAVGVTFAATSDLRVIDKARGRIWLVARPVNQPNSREISFTDVVITGETGKVSGDFLLALANTSDFRTAISDGLRQNFENDFTKLRAKIDKAVAQRVDGPVAYRVVIDQITTGQIEAHGEGLFLPVAMHAAITAELTRAK